jgi:hypothetical protein
MERKILTPPFNKGHGLASYTELHYKDYTLSERISYITRLYG